MRKNDAPRIPVEVSPTKNDKKDDNMDSREYLNYVLDKLQERIRKLDDAILHGQKEIENMHEYYWENYTEMDQYGYENFDNQQALLHEINASNEKIELRRRFRKMMDSPFFGRVDFCYEGEDEPEDILYRNCEPG